MHSPVLPVAATPQGLPAHSPGCHISLWGGLETQLSKPRWMGARLVLPLTRYFEFAPSPQGQDWC